MTNNGKTVEQVLFENTPEIERLAALCEKSNAIDKELYTEYDVKRGLRDVNGKIGRASCRERV